MVEKLLKQRTDVNLITSEGDTPLILAIKNGIDVNSKKIINLLIRHRADPAKKNNSNETPLQHATEYLLSIEDSIKLFLEGREFSPAFASDLNRRAKDGIPLFHHISEIRGDINNLQKNGSFTNWLIENFCADPFIRQQTLTSDLARYLYQGEHLINILLYY